MKQLENVASYCIFDIVLWAGEMGMEGLKWPLGQQFETCTLEFNISPED